MKKSKSSLYDFDTHGHNNHDPEVREEGWKDEIHFLKPVLEEKKLPVTIQGILLYIETMDDIDEIERVFDYPEDFNYKGRSVN